MKGAGLFLLFLIVMANCQTPEPMKPEFENPIAFFVFGLWYCFTGFLHDLFHKTPSTPQDAYKTVAEIIMTAGYTFETHKIVTPDGYINTAWRIVGKLDQNGDPEPEKKPCVVLQHGLLDNSATWLILDKSEALPFRLVDEGYDVWMTNSRGNINSYEHMHPETHNIHDISSDYFKFSFGDMAQYDVPSNLDYVLAHSNYDKAFYVGHSQGTTQFFAAADVVPELEDRVAGYVALAPVMYIGNIYNPFLWLLAHTGLAQVMGWLKIYNFFIIPTYFNPLMRAFAIHFRTFVWRLLGLAMGIDEIIRSDLSRMPVMANHEPGGTSYFNMMHWLQSYLTSTFAPYDWGKKENLERYGQEEAPKSYNLTHIADTFQKFPTAMFVGENDALVPPKDFEKLKNLLKDVDIEYHIIPHYAHVDLIWGKTCKENVFDPTVEFIKKHTESLEPSNQ